MNSIEMIASQASTALRHLEATEANALEVKLGRGSCRLSAIDEATVTVQEDGHRFTLEFDFTDPVNLSIGSVDRIDKSRQTITVEPDRMEAFTSYVLDLLFD